MGYRAKSNVPAIDGEETVCSCGKHRGVGSWDVLKRAAMLAHRRDRLPHAINGEQRRWLGDFEAVHGPVIWKKEQGEVVYAPPVAVRKPYRES